MLIAICEDEPLMAASIQSTAQQWAAQKNTELEAMLYSNPEDALDDWQRGRSFDLFLIDIQYGQDLMSGLELAQEIRRVDTNVPLAFITSYQGYVYKGYEVNALRYLLKPVETTALFECLDVAKNLADFADCPSLILTTVDGELLSLPHKSILYVESLGHRLTVHTVQRSYELYARTGIGELIPRLPEKTFVRTHRSYVVNIGHVRRIDGMDLYLKGNIRLPVGRSYTAALRNAFEAFHIGG